MTDESDMISVIIPVWNDAERLGRCLSALVSQVDEDGRTEVIVVDNGSADEPSRVLPDHPQFRLVVENRIGSYAARNRGLQEAGGSIVAFIDSDCIPMAGWLAVGRQSVGRGGPADVAGGPIEVVMETGTTPLAPALHSQHFLFDAPGRFEAERTLYNANLWTRMNVVEALGGFDDSRRSGGDWDFCKRALSQGYRLRFIEGLGVRHATTESWAEFTRRAIRLAGGLYQRRRAKGGVLAALHHAGTNPPPVAKAIRIALSVRYGTMEQRLRIAGAELVRHTVFNAEYARLLLGGTPRGR